MAYIDGSLEKENGNHDNYTEIIPLYTVGYKASRELGKANFDRAIEKCEKAIHLHSIKRKPEWNKSRRKTPRDIAWLNRREYNPFLWKAWMLMGRSQFYKGDFDGAASTFAYMSRLYETQPSIYGRARAWLAKCYIENEYLYDAEDVIRNMRRDSIHWRAQKEWNYTFADYYIHSGDYEKAIPYLRKVIKSEMRRKQKAREWFLMGQLCQSLKRNDEAYKAFQHCIRLNPPYELEFNARIAQTEVLADHQSDRMISRLKRMARSDKNAGYLDQVYYAIGNIYLAQKDTAKAIAAYEEGNKKSTRSGIEKGVLMLRLGDLYWVKEKFNDSQRCYNEAIGLLDKERPDYAQLSYRSKVLDELVPYTDAVHLQDSFQLLAKMDEHERNAAIDRVIESLIKKEKEEKRAKDEAAAQETMSESQATGDRDGTQTTTRRATPAVRPTQTSQQSKTWYFYNPTAVQQGKQIFQRQWGKRENVDDWQRVNKTVVGDLSDQNGPDEYTDEQRDSIFKEQDRQDSIKSLTDSAQNDPHKREYYLAQIPFTAEQVEASNAIIMDGLYNSGVIFKDKLDNLRLSEKALRRLADSYPSYEHMDDAFYHLFLLYSRENEPLLAKQYVDSLSEKFPTSQWTTLLTDPDYVRNSRYGEHIEDSLYAATYEAFKADRFGEVRANATLSTAHFPLGANRDKFIFISALGKLNDGNPSACLEDLDSLVRNYPTSKLSELAGMIINGVKEGRTLRGGKFDIGDVWSRRGMEMSDSAQLSQQQLSNERNTPFVFMLVYQPDSVNENKLLFQLARYNFTSFLVRDFDIAIERDDDLHRMSVAGFRNYDEALQYARLLMRQPQIIAVSAKARPVIISQENLPLLGTAYSYDDYDKFYNRHFAPLSISTFNLLSEPAQVVTGQEDDAPEGEEQESQPTQTDIDNYLNDTFVGIDEPAASDSTSTTIVPEEEAAPAGNNATTVVPEEETAPSEDNVTTVSPEEEAAPSDSNAGTVVSEEEAAPAGSNNTTVVPDEKTMPAPTRRVEENKGDARVPSVPQVNEPAGTVTDDDGINIFFNDDDNPSSNQQTVPQQDSQKSQQKDKQSIKEPETFDFEDEYYDLDGF